MLATPAIHCLMATRYLSTKAVARPMASIPGHLVVTLAGQRERAAGMRSARPFSLAGAGYWTTAVKFVTARLELVDPVQISKPPNTSVRYQPLCR